jgi:DNA-binding MarR family transcriptional regulator
MASRRTEKRARLLAELEVQGRRTGSVGTLHGKAIADRAGLHGTDFECLDVLDWTGPITAGELARRVGITSGAVTGVIDRLERGGWVRRVADRSDRRRVIVEMVPPDPTGPNAERFAQAAALLGQLQQDMHDISERFDDDQLAAILDYLRSANEAVERSTERLRHRS